MSEIWIAAGAVALAAHLGAVAYVETREPIARPKVVLEMQLAKLPAKPVEPPPPARPPPPPKPDKPRLVKRIAKAPPPQTLRVGIDEKATAEHADMAVATGGTLDGTIGTGTTTDKTLPPPPPELPAPPPAPPPPQKPRFFPSYEVTRLPRAIHPVQPDIPAAFRDAQREAVVVVEVEIDASGRVASARVLRHAEFGLDDAALAAAKQTVFEPALMGTQPVPVRFQIPYRFKVRG